VHCRANEAYEAYRAGGVMKDGRRFGKPPTPYRPPPTPAGKVNVTDPDSRNVKTPCGYAQGYNAQAVCNERQIVVAAEINADSPDFGQLEPMVSAAERELADAGLTGTARTGGPPTTSPPSGRTRARATGHRSWLPTGGCVAAGRTAARAVARPRLGSLGWPI
jgi:hypothetical protein